MSPPPPTILLVEDSEDDAFIMKYALKRAGIVNPLQVVTDGQMAVNYLAGNQSYSDRAQFPLPFLVFLDLKLPYVHGFEVLEWIGKQNALSSLVVIVLTSSSEERDQQRAYALGARSYLVKPPTPETLLDIFDSLKSYWLSKTGSPPIVTALNAPASGR